MRKNQPGCPCCGSSPDGPGDIEGCFCQHSPALIAMTTPGPCFGVINPCTFEWGATPPEFASYVPEANSYFSVELFYDDFEMLYYRWHLDCLQFNYQIARAYYYPGGGGLVQFGWYYWTATTPPNTCEPFSQTAGVRNDSVPLTCVVELHG